MTTEQAPLKIPALLLEGDEPAVSSGATVAKNPQTESRLGALSAETTPPAPEASPAPASAVPVEPSVSKSGELPEAYGTGKLFLVARDPHCLYTHWDISPEDQSHYNQLAASHHLIVRVHPGNAETVPANEVHASSESRHCFIPVGQADMTYVAELGYYLADGQWRAITASSPATTPPDAVSEDKTLQFANIPGRASEPGLPETAPAMAGPTAPVRPAVPFRVLPSLHPPRVGWLPTLDSAAPGFPEIPFFAQEPATTIHPRLETDWTAEDECAFVEFAALVRRRQRSFDSMALVEYLHSQLPSSISSPTGGEQPPLPGFWFDLNAELVVYGATEPDASVTIAGRPIQLRPDGTFSCRFALPDGAHQLPVTAVSSRGDLRQAELNFTRRTDFQDQPADAVNAPAEPLDAPPFLDP
jgi:hypothetical protein